VTSAAPGHNLHQRTPKAANKKTGVRTKQQCVQSKSLPPDSSKFEQDHRSRRLDEELLKLEKPE
jgi:hypothetical protein